MNKTLHYITEERCKDFEKKLNRLLTKDRIYLDADLTVDTLASKLKTNTTYLYYYMHDVLKTKFYTIVNTRRVDDAKTMLKESEIKLDIIATKCGFNSTRSFMRVFKNVVGMTPTEWRIANKD